MRTPLRALLIAAVLVATLAGCSRHSPLAPASPNGTGSAAAHSARAAARSDARHVDGRTGPSSFYTLDVPDGWNGDLVLYAHGITLPASAPLALPDVGPLRDALLANGFAVAMSSFDANGYALKDGLERTQQLSGLFAAHFGPPRHTYVVGASLGAIIGLDMVESQPGRYDGLVTAAGVLGGTLDEMNHAATLRVLFDALYAGVLPGTLYDVPPVDPNQVVAGAVAAIQQHPEGLGVILAVMGDRLRYTPGNVPEMIGAVVGPLVFQVLAADNVTDLMHGHPFFDNMDVVYQGLGIPQPVLDDLNARVARYRADPSALAYVRHYYEPDGDLHVKMIAVHAIRDPQVPYWHVEKYLALVAAAGHSDALLVRPYDSAQHPGVAPANIVQAVVDLAQWVETGVKPGS